MVVLLCRSFHTFSDMVNVLKTQTLFHFLFSNKTLVILTGIDKKLVQRATREDPDQTASPATV